VPLLDHFDFVLDGISLSDYLMTYELKQLFLYLSNLLTDFYETWGCDTSVIWVLLRVLQSVLLATLAKCLIKKVFLRV
jgi:hypothetical protein